MSNASALFRSLLVYGLCLPLAVCLGYLLATPFEGPTTLIVVVITLFVLTIPLLLRWHHVWLIASWNMTAMLFFLPGKPAVWMGLAAASFTISILQYALNRKMKFLQAPSVTRPLLFFTAVVLLTARLTGGLGMKIMGGDAYGGKHYFEILLAVIGYFAIINRQIPPRRANLYVTLFFAGAATMAIGDLPGRVNPALNFLFVFFPVSSMDAFTNQTSVVAQTSLIERPGGLAFLGLGCFCAMLARYGIRGVLDTTKPWRLGAFCFFIAAGLLSGFRSVLVLVLLTFALLFYLERLHHTRLLLPVLLVSLLGGGLMLVFATRMPLSIQRSLAVLPFVQIDPMARMSARASSEWRVQMWQDVLPEIPRYLLLGKGYTFSARELAQVQRGRSLDSTELVGNYHNGPLSVILPFGLFGSIAFVWFVVAGIRVVYQNYQFGDRAYHNINVFLFAYFVVKVFFFFTVFGGLNSDLPMFLGLLGLSISLNGGVAKPAIVPQPNVVFNRFRLHPSARRPVGV
jgi:hypothetical protein